MGTTISEQGKSIDAALEYARVLRRFKSWSPRDRSQIRKRAELRQIDVARAMRDEGCPASREAVVRWERGDRTPRGHALVAYVKVLDRLIAETLRR